MSRRNSRDGMERTSQSYHGNINQSVPGGYPVPFPHFPWGMQSHASSTGVPRPPVPGQHGNRQDGQDNLANFYRNLPALHQSMGENNMSSSSRQQSQMVFQAHGIRMRYPPPLISEVQKKDQGMNQRPMFSIPQTNRHVRSKYPTDSHTQRSGPISGMLPNHMNLHGLPFSPSPPDYNYPAISQMLEQDSGMGHRPSMSHGAVPPWIPQLNQSQRIPHMSNLMPSQFRNPPSGTITDPVIPREATTSPGLIGRWYKLPTEEDKNESKVVEKALPESNPSDKTEERLLDDSITQKTPSSGPVDNNVGKLQGLIDRLRASKEEGYRKEDPVVGQPPRNTITISPETCVQSFAVSQSSTIRISPEIPSLPLRIPGSDVCKINRSFHPVKDSDEDCDISIINCFTLNADGTCGSKEDIPIIIEDENPRPSPSVVAESNLENKTRNKESFLQNEGTGISEIIIPASTLTIEANEISCSEASSQDEQLPLGPVAECSERSSEQVKTKKNSTDETTIAISEENEKTGTTENSRKESDQFRIKLKMSCTSESGIICRFSKIASAGICSRLPRGSPDSQKSEITLSPPNESRQSSENLELKEHSEKSNSLPIITSACSLFKTAHNPAREKKTMHVQPLQQVIQNSVTDTSDLLQTSSSSGKQPGDCVSLEKERIETVVDGVSVFRSVCEEPSVCSLENISQKSSPDDVDTPVNVEKAEPFSPHHAVLSDTFENAVKDKMEQCSTTPPSSEIVAGSNVQNPSSSAEAITLSNSTELKSTTGSSSEMPRTEPESIESASGAEMSTHYPARHRIKSKTHFLLSGKKFKNGKQKNRKKQIKAVGKRICVSSLKHRAISECKDYEVELKDVLKNETDISVECPSSDKKVSNTSIATGAASLVKDSLTRSSKGLEAVYESCMKNIEIPSNRSYYNTKIFKKKYTNTKRQIKKLAKVSNTSLCPDPKQPLSSLVFHGSRLLCLKMTTDRYFIMRELLKSCFSTSKPSHNGVQKYRQIYLAKERDLKIPYVELPATQKDKVVKYLKEEGHMVSFSKATHVGIITVTDALRLYHFFKGVKLCGENCIEGENAILSDNSGGTLDVPHCARKVCHEKMPRTAESGNETSNSIEAYLEQIQHDKLASRSDGLSPISDDIVGASICDRGVDTSQDRMSENEEYNSDDSDATIPYINGIALKRRNLEDVRSGQKKRFKSVSVYGGIAELYGNTFRFIALDGKKFVPFEDLCFYFDEDDVRELVKQCCFEVHTCSHFEISFLNKVDKVLPELNANICQLVEDDVLHAIAGNAKSILQNFFKKNWQKERIKMNELSNTVETIQSSDITMETVHSSDIIDETVENSPTSDANTTEDQTSPTDDTCIQSDKCSVKDSRSPGKHICVSEKTDESMQVVESPVESSTEQTQQTQVDESQLNSGNGVMGSLNSSYINVSSENSVQGNFMSPVPSLVSQNKKFVVSPLAGSVSKSSPQKLTEPPPHSADVPSIISELNRL